MPYNTLCACCTKAGSQTPADHTHCSYLSGKSLLVLAMIHERSPDFSRTLTSDLTLVLTLPKPCWRATLGNSHSDNTASLQPCT